MENLQQLLETCRRRPIFQRFQVQKSKLGMVKQLGVKDPQTIILYFHLSFNLSMLQFLVFPPNLDNKARYPISIKSWTTI